MEALGVGAAALATRVVVVVEETPSGAAYIALGGGPRVVGEAAIAALGVWAGGNCPSGAAYIALGGGPPVVGASS